jgi:23S rRNA A1618 N6-methylase RlmF
MFNDARRSLKNQRCLRTLVAFKMTNLLFVAIVVQLPNARFSLRNSGIEPDRFTAILCNPPFHQQHAITDHIAWQMFNDALTHLGRFQNDELIVRRNRRAITKRALQLTEVIEVAVHYRPYCLADV